MAGEVIQLRGLDGVYDMLRKLPAEARSHVEGNVGSWQSERKYLSTMGRDVADKRIAHGNDVIERIDAALRSER